MTKIKISMFAVAFLFAAGAAIASSDTIQEGWYQPDYTPGQTPQTSVPGDCSVGFNLCATHYNALGIQDGIAEKP